MLNEFTRRGFLGTAAAVGGTTVVTTALGGAPAAEAAVPEAADGGACGARTSLVKVDRADRRYQDLVTRGFNGRFRGRPDVVYVVHSADQVVDAVNQAVAAGRMDRGAQRRAIASRASWTIPPSGPSSTCPR